MKSDLFGDQVSLANGSLSFSATDVAIPGNNSLSVAFSRSYAVQNQYGRVMDKMLADWDLEVPSISGTFAPNWTAGVPGDPGRRCSAPAHQATPNAPVWDINLSDFWQGNTLNIPGGAGGELLQVLSGAYQPSTGGPFHWMTTGQAYVSCLSSIKNTTGEGFLAITPDGTKYWFDWMAQYHEPDMSSANGGSQIARRKNVLYATKVQDRFGNTVLYQYTNAWNAPGRLTSITGSDGRALNIAYNAQGHVSTVTQGSRTWTYQYVGTGANRSLSAVIQPDASSWSINFAAFTSASLHYPPPSSQPFPEPTRDCFWRFNMPIGPTLVTGTIQHPSGAVGTFELEWLLHGRSNVPVSCHNFDWGGSSGTNTSDDVNEWAISYELYSLKKKTMSGPGMPVSEWNYSYTPNISYDFYPGGDMMTPCPVGSTCGEPLCTSDACARSAETIVLGPDNERTKYYHGNSFRYNEGKLLRIERGSVTDPLMEVQTFTYDLSMAPQVYPERFGMSLRHNFDGFTSEYHRPRQTSKTSRGGIDFTNSVAFDSLARPVVVTRTNSAAGSQAKIETTTYHDNQSLWVLGQTQKLVVNGHEVSESTFDTLARPSISESYGKIMQTLTYNTDGTVATVKDGNNNVTTASNWKRGIPQTIQYPATPEASTGAVQSAVVDDSGWITSVIDENGYKTCYAYDAMGRISQVTFPSETTAGACDDSKWAVTTQVFEPVATAEYGIPAGHWRQTVSTGNARKITYFDALWRPQVKREYDAANEVGTRRFQRFAYDHEGRTTFASYPGTTDVLNTGTWTDYDALGRTTSVSQDSELSPSVLVTQTQYLSDANGLYTRVTDPHQRQTSTWYQMFDQPSYEQATVIQHPENTRTEIERDVFGKPLTLTRRSNDNIAWQRRYYAYDAHQQLCKSSENETGTSAYGYDGAGNLSWSAAGLSWSPSGPCEHTKAGVISRRVDRMYDARNRLQMIVFPDGKGDQSWSYTRDGLPASITTYNSAPSDNLGTQVVNAYTYNRRRLLTGESVAQPDYTWSIGYAYETHGHLSTLTYPSGLVVNQAPNALGQPTQAGTYATAASYYPNGAVKQFTYGNGIVHTLTQNARQLPARSTDSIGGTKPLDLGYAYDGVGNVSGITDHTAAARQTRSMTYDGLDRLTQAVSPMFGTASYGYNALDNLTSVVVTGGNNTRNHQYVYDTSMRLGNIKSGGVTVVGFGYDEQGNLANKNGQLYQFDYGNRLREATGKETYRYDGHGRRVEATSPTLGRIRSMYGQEGALRRQEDARTGKHHEYVMLAGSLVARVTTIVAPGTPSLSVPTYSSNGSYTVSWSATATATGYELQESVGGGSWQAAYTGSAVQRGYSGKGSGSYAYRVRACQASTCSNWSNTGTVTVELAPASAPGLTVPATALNGNYTVSWTSIAGATNYTLEQSANGGGWTVEQNTGALSKAYSGKTAGAYAYRVKACNPAGCGPVSGTGTTQSVHAPASAPTLTAPASSYSGSYSLSWTAVAAAASYRLEERPSGGAWTVIHDTSGTSTTVSGRASGSHEYRAMACNAAGCGPYSATSVVAVTLAPGAAPSLTVPASSHTGSYTVSWSGVTGATTYQLEESLSGAAWTLIHNAAGGGSAVGGRPAGTHGYRVRACNAAGCGPYSSTGSVLVTLPPTGVPTLTLPSSSETGGYVINWTTVSAATSYRLQERPAGGGWTEIYNEAFNQTQVIGKPPGTYEYQVMACNSAGCGGMSAVKSITLATPPVPQGLTAYQDTHSCEIAWSPSGGATSYELRNTGGLVYQGPNTWLSRYSPPTCVSPYEVRACNALGCSVWSPPAYATGGGGGPIQ
ncbi:RHS repeat protein [Pseudoxanthomonas sp. LARHCG66]